MQFSQWGAVPFCCVLEDTQPDGTDMAANWQGDGATAHGRHTLQVLSRLFFAGQSAEPGNTNWYI